MVDDQQLVHLLTNGTTECLGNLQPSIVEFLLALGGLVHQLLIIHHMI